MRLLAEMGPDNLAEIAKSVGVNRGTLYRWPVFMEAVERQRAAEQWVPRAPRARAVPHDEL
jgi:AcrR family transcriptional regulator